MGMKFFLYSEKHNTNIVCMLSKCPINVANFLILQKYLYYIDNDASENPTGVV